MRFPNFAGSRICKSAADFQSRMLSDGGEFRR